MAADDRFQPAVGAWTAGLGRVRDVVRQELVAAQLAAHLRPAGPGPTPPRALDLGCGQGTQAIRLARAGLDVTGVDRSPDLLAAARAASAGEPAPVRDRLTFVTGDLTALDSLFAGAFDAVCCHGVLMYLPDLDTGLPAVVDCARPGAVISVLTRNRFGIALRAALSGDWDGAVRGFDARTYRNRIGVDDARADEPAEVAAALRRCGATPVAWYGVRLFTDHWGAEDPPANVADIIAAEWEAGRRDPYRSLAALTHTIAVRQTGGPDRLSEPASSRSR